MNRRSFVKTGGMGLGALFLSRYAKAFESLGNDSDLAGHPDVVEKLGGDFKYLLNNYEGKLKINLVNLDGIKKPEKKVSDIVNFFTLCGLPVSEKMTGLKGKWLKYHSIENYDPRCMLDVIAYRDTPLNGNFWVHAKLPQSDLELVDQRLIDPDHEFYTELCWPDDISVIEMPINGKKYLTIPVSGEEMGKAKGQHSPEQLLCYVTEADKTNAYYGENGNMIISGSPITRGMRFDMFCNYLDSL
jgi:hypothetical protein